jgi:hypothetical protein
MSARTNLQPSLLWTWNRTLDRAPHLLTGVLLFLVMFAIEPAGGGR